jgi:septal ring factor EnvC (AmiA/AmiB activator)
MSGPRILLAVLLLAVVLLWLALTRAGDSDLDRGLAETQDAIEHVEAELAALDSNYQALRAQGLVLGLREQHDRVVTLLAQHKDRRVEVRTDPSIDPRQRLPLLRDLVDQIDETLALAVTLHRTVDAIVGFRKDAAPLMTEARKLRDALEAVTPPDTAWGDRRSTLAGSLADLDQRLATADHMLRDNPEQGRKLGEKALADLRTLMDEQRQLRAAAGAEN